MKLGYITNIHNILDHYGIDSDHNIFDICCEEDSHRKIKLSLDNIQGGITANFYIYFCVSIYQRYMDNFKPRLIQ